MRVAGALTLRGLVAGYGRRRVLHGVDVDAPAGSVTLVVGANGAGKTTLMRAISGLVSVSAGRLRVGRIDLRGVSPARIARMGVGHVEQGRDKLAELTVDEHLRLGAIHRRDGGVGRDMERWCEAFPALARRRELAAGSLSGGEQQMLAVARTMMSHPTVVCFDEPTEGLAPDLVALLLDRVRSIADDGATVVLVEQPTAAAVEIADRVAVMVRGEITSQMSGDEARRDLDRLRSIAMGV